jgi:hypothetical protein
MDWNVLGIIAIVTTIWVVCYRVIRHFDDGDMPVLIDILVSSFLAVGLIVAGAFVVGGVVVLGTTLYHWGLLNTLVAATTIAGIGGVGLFGKTALIRLTAGVPHFTSKFFHDFKTRRLEYKNHLEEKFPVRRSVYELIDEKD